MKVLSLSVFCLGALYAQVAPSPAQTTLSLPNLPDDTKVAACTDGSAVAMSELRTMIGDMDFQHQQAAISKMGESLDQICLARWLAKMAQDDKLDQNSPWKERLVSERVTLLAQAELQKLSNPQNIDGSELEAYYNENKSRFEQVKVSDIYVAFRISDEPQAGDGPKVPTLEEARAKITKLLTQIRAGADFKKLARENSDDEISRSKDGYFATLNPVDNGIPDAVKVAIFNLKAGEVSDVVKQPTGFYIFRADEIAYKPYASVRDQIYGDVKMNRFNQAMQKLQEDNKAKVLAPELIKSK